MKCTSCGTEIADKALICYRCGTPTSAPVSPVKPAGRRGLVGRLLVVAALLALVAAALFLGRAGQIQLSPQVSYTLAALVALLLVWRLWRRRRRRPVSFR
jgi:hypothetical protein